VTDRRTDRQTDRRTDGIAIAYERLAYILSRAIKSVIIQIRSGNCIFYRSTVLVMPRYLDNDILLSAEQKRHADNYMHTYIHRFITRNTVKRSSNQRWQLLRDEGMKVK